MCSDNFRSQWKHWLQFDVLILCLHPSSTDIEYLSWRGKLTDPIWGYRQRKQAVCYRLIPEKFQLLFSGLSGRFMCFMLSWIWKAAGGMQKMCKTRINTILYCVCGFLVPSTPWSDNQECSYKFPGDGAGEILLEPGSKPGDNQRAWWRLKSRNNT